MCILLKIDLPLGVYSRICSVALKTHYPLSPGHTDRLYVLYPPSQQVTAYRRWLFFPPESSRGVHVPPAAIWI